MCVPKFKPVRTLLIAVDHLSLYLHTHNTCSLISDQSPWQYNYKIFIFSHLHPSSSQLKQYITPSNACPNNISFFAPPLMGCEHLPQLYKTLSLCWQAVILLCIKLLHHGELRCCHSRWWNKWSLHSMATWQRYEHECAAIGVYWQVWWKISDCYNARRLQSWSWSNEVREWIRTLHQVPRAICILWPILPSLCATFKVNVLVLSFSWMWNPTCFLNGMEFTPGVWLAKKGAHRLFP